MISTGNYTKVLKVFLLIVLFINECIIIANAQFIFDLFGLSDDKSKSSKYKFEFIEGDKVATDEILLIKISGLIYDREDVLDSPFELRQNLIKRINEDIDAALEAKNVKGVLLEINSPGGEMTTCDIIYNKIVKIKKEKKPIVAIFKQLGTSGAYYIACAADYILAHPTSLIGNIGVILKTINIEKLAQILGIKDVTIKSEKSPKKDFLSPFRSLSEEEQKMLAEITNDLYDRFVEIISKSRKKSKEEILKVADGSVYTAKKALENGLIDQIGYREDALEVFKKLLNVKSLKLVKRKEKKSFFSLLSDVIESSSNSNLNINLSLEKVIYNLMMLELPIVY